jgi:hypothetical protein
MQRNLNELKEFRAVLESSAFYLDVLSSLSLIHYMSQRTDF